MGDQPCTDGGNRLLHAGPQVFQCPQALFLRLFLPLLKPALIRPTIGRNFETRLVADQPEQEEFRIKITVKDGLEVPLHVGDPGQGYIVAQEAESKPVGDNPPMVLVAGIEHLLDKRVGAGLGGSHGARRAAVQIHMSSDQMDRNRTPAMGNRVALAIDLDGASGHKTAKIEFLE